jgi:hypothetical protein
VSTTPTPSPAPTPTQPPATPEPEEEFPQYNLGSAVYGLITVSALIAAESAAQETYGETVAGVVLAILLYWVAHAYSELVARRVRRGEPLTPASLARMLRRELPILGGASPPLLAVLIAWVGGATLGTAIDIALWTGVATIIAVEVTAGIQAELSGRRLLVQAVVGAALGLLILALRLVLH